MTSQLEHDLARRFRERLNTIIGDSFELYEMAELTPKDAGNRIANELLQAFVKVCLILNDDIQPTRETINTIATIITAMLEKERLKREKEEQS